MLIDTNTIEGRISSKICIIGSGVGGGTLAKKLSDNNIDFIIVEAGGLKGNSNIVKKEHVGRDFGMKTTTSIQVGGTSNLWHGVLSPLDEIDFEAREWIPHSGWPISKSDLDPYYLQAEQLFGTKDCEYFYEEGLPHNLKTELLGLEFNREYLENKLFQQPLPVTNFKDVIMDIVSESSSSHCYYNAVALELIYDDGSDSTISSLLVGASNGRKVYVDAGTFIVSCGALETPRLLLNSTGRSSSGIGNEGDIVGRYLSDHPMGNLCQLKFKHPHKASIYSDLKYRADMKIKTGLELKQKYQRELRIPNHNFFLRPSFVEGIDDESEKIKLSLLAFKDKGITFKDVIKVVKNYNVVRQILAYKLTLNVTFKYADLMFITEQIPNPDSRITLSAQNDEFDYPVASIDWQVSQDDIDGMRVWFDLLQDKLFPESEYIFTHQSDDFKWEDIFTTAIHHVGTARMSDTVNDGVVDSNLKIFGVNNVYICDGSVFTTAGNVNSSLTISALACRLAKHLSTIISRGISSG